MNKKYTIVFFLLMTLPFLSIGQDFNFGVRARFNYSNFLGPGEADMQQGYSLNNGLHFGATFAYSITNIAGIRAELLYQQIGTKDSIVGSSYYIFPVGGERVAKEGYAKRFYDVSNAYITIPLMGYVYPTKSFELYGGAYVAFLINPTAGGRIEFDDLSEDTKFGFTQSFDYNYYQDEPMEGINYTRSISVNVDDEDINLWQVAGAYEQFESKNGSTYNVFDMGLTAGFSYYINRNFFMGIRAEYGLLDLTNDKMDISFRNLDSEGKFILRDDFDRNLNFNLSLGFKF